MRISSWNINSVRKRPDILTAFIKEINPDIICLQETKVIDSLFPTDFFSNLGYKYQFIRGEPSYNGVAILSKLSVKERTPITSIKESRHLVVELQGGIELHNFYVPAGGDIPDPEVNNKFKYKLEFVDNLCKWFKDNKNKESKIILLGDLNIAPLENDVWSHKQLLKIVSHTPVEVEKLNNLYSSINFVDAARKFVPESEKLYSWWSYRNRDWRKSDRGRRLDHIWVSKPLSPLIKKCFISKEFRGHDSPSDHVPVTIDLELC